jgi:hypothetical protein
VLPDRYAICHLDPTAEIPDWCAKGEFVSISRTSDELSLVCLESSIPAGTSCEPGWRVLKCEGPLDFALPGIMAALADPLADAAIPIFPIATYETDYVLIKEAHLETAINALTTYGHAVRV